jgi:hypothetical protein
VKLNSKNTLSEAVRSLRKHISGEEFGSLNMFHRTFKMTFLFLPEIWNRILEDAKLETKYWEVYVALYEPGAEEREPTAEELKILNTWREHRFCLNLDVEDWFIHSYILMDKFARLAKRFTQQLSKTTQNFNLTLLIPDKSFAKYRNFYLKDKNQDLITDTEYAEIIRKNTTWYKKELKNIRDDLIQHETVPKSWGYSVSKNKVRLSRFRHSPKLREKLYKLKDKYAPIYPQIAEEKNFFTLLVFFEKHLNDLAKKDVKELENARKLWGARFPDIPRLFGKMSDFFYLVNVHFVSKIQERFEKQKV